MNFFYYCIQGNEFRIERQIFETFKKNRNSTTKERI